MASCFSRQLSPEKLKAVHSSLLANWAATPFCHNREQQPISLASISHPELHHSCSSLAIQAVQKLNHQTKPPHECFSFDCLKAAHISWKQPVLKPFPSETFICYKQIFSSWLLSIPSAERLFTSLIKHLFFKSSLNITFFGILLLSSRRLKKKHFVLLFFFLSLGSANSIWICYTL